MRPWCEGCARPNTVCLCDVLPAPPGWPTCTRILILQHPHELKHKLATVPLLARCLPACQVVVGRRLHSTSSPLLPPASPSHLPLLLFPGPHAQELGSWYAALTSSQQLQEGIASAPLQVHEAQVHTDGKAQSETTNSEVEGCGQDTNLVDNCSKVAQKDEIDKTKAGSVQITLVVVDGTWEHAQEMVKASLPFLSQFVVQVCLPFDKHSEGDGMGDSDLIMRKEPFGGCVSTMEAVARSLAILEADGHTIEEKLMAVLRKMVKVEQVDLRASQAIDVLKNGIHQLRIHRLQGSGHSTGIKAKLHNESLMVILEAQPKQWVHLERWSWMLLQVLVAGASLEGQFEQLASNPDVNMLYGMQA